MNIGEIKTQPDGGYISGPITGRISSCKAMQTKTGKTMWVGKLGDEDDTVDLQSFDLNFTGWDNQEVVLTGKGMKKDSYNNYAKLQLGKSVRIDAADGSAPVAAPKATAPAKAAAPASVNHPATVGLAAKILVDLERIRMDAIGIYNAAQGDSGDGLVVPDSERLSSWHAHWEKDLKIWIDRLQRAERGEL